MPSRSILYTTLFLSLVFAALAFAGIMFYFYWVYWWYDVMMHALAGVVGGLAAYCVLYRSGRFLSHGSPSRFAAIMIPTALFFVVAVVWEYLEFVTGTAFPQGNYAFDTASDIVLGVVGSIVAIALCERIKRYG